MGLTLNFVFVRLAMVGPVLIIVSPLPVIAVIDGCEIFVTLRSFLLIMLIYESRLLFLRTYLDPLFGPLFQTGAVCLSIFLHFDPFYQFPPT